MTMASVGLLDMFNAVVRLIRKFRGCHPQEKEVFFWLGARMTDEGPLTLVLPDKDMFFLEVAVDDIVMEYWRFRRSGRRPNISVEEAQTLFRTMWLYLTTCCSETIVTRTLPVRMDVRHVVEQSVLSGEQWKKTEWSLNDAYCITRYRNLVWRSVADAPPSARDGTAATVEVGSQNNHSFSRGSAVGSAPRVVSSYDSRRNPSIPGSIGSGGSLQISPQMRFDQPQGHHAAALASDPLALGGSPPPANPPLAGAVQSTLIRNGSYLAHFGACDADSLSDDEDEVEEPEGRQWSLDHRRNLKEDSCVEQKLREAVSLMEAALKPLIAAECVGISSHDEIAQLLEEIA